MGWYRGPLREMLRALKFRRRPDLAAPLARRAHAFLRPRRGLLEGLDLIVPVPLPLLRRLHRGYNQSAELASHLAARMRLPVRRRALRRRAASPPQARLPAAGREANARRSFRARARLDGQAVLLLDDVWTTGATMRACARALREAGAGRIVAFSLARTPADFDGSAEPSL
jgi:ComF family protein